METNNGLLHVASPHSVPETLNRLESVLRSNGLTVFARVNHIGEAQKVGLTMPPTQLLIFGGLFAAADAVFEGMVTRLFDWNVDALAEHIAATAFCAWSVGGLLRQALIGSDWLRHAGQEQEYTPPTFLRTYGLAAEPRNSVDSPSLRSAIEVSLC